MFCVCEHEGCVSTHEGVYGLEYFFINFVICDGTSITAFISRCDAFTHRN